MLGRWADFGLGKRAALSPDARAEREKAVVSALNLLMQIRCGKQFIRCNKYY
jgi:hypothetical protein